MFDLIAGLPVHPLIVHAIVVLGPLAGLMLLAYVFRPGWRAGLKWPLVVCAVVAGASAFVAKQSGESLQGRVGNPGDHAEWGDLAFMASGVLMLVTLVVVFALAKPVLVDTAAAPAGTAATPARTGAGRRTLAAVLAVLATLAVWVTIFGAGHSGAQKVWTDRIAHTTAGHE